MNERSIYGVGTKAYIDSFGGLVPCIVQAIKYAFEEYTQVVVKVTAHRPGYSKGDVVEFNPSTVVPRDRVSVRRGRHYINTQYAWQ